jgi:hypothetical protein
MMHKKSEERRRSGIRKIQLFVSVSMLAFFVTSCNLMTEKNNHPTKDSSDTTQITQKPDAAMDSVVLFLIDASAKDFNDNQPPVPVGFRNVQIKNLTGPDNEDHFMLCGQFLAQDKQDKDEWIYFVTIKTDPYEQWIGSNALTYCQDASPVSYKVNDLSAALKSRVDAVFKSDHPAR